MIGTQRLVGLFRAGLIDERPSRYPYQVHDFMEPGQADNCKGSNGPRNQIFIIYPLAAAQNTISEGAHEGYMHKYTLLTSWGHIRLYF